jgi:hypothetical protein
MLAGLAFSGCSRLDTGYAGTMAMMGLHAGDTGAPEVSDSKSSMAQPDLHLLSPQGTHALGHVILKKLAFLILVYLFLAGLP